jgi:uncharacterized protein (TIGR00251 family)
MQNLVRAGKGGVLLSVRVVPRSARNEIAGVQANALKVRLNAPPVGGAANAALVALVAKSLRVPQRDVEIVSGLASRLKTLRIVGMCPEDVQSRLDNVPRLGR